MLSHRDDQSEQLWKLYCVKIVALTIYSCLRLIISIKTGVSPLADKLPIGRDPHWRSRYVNESGTCARKLLALIKTGMKTMGQNNVHYGCLCLLLRSLLRSRSIWLDQLCTKEKRAFYVSCRLLLLSIFEILPFLFLIVAPDVSKHCLWCSETLPGKPWNVSLTY